MCSTLRWKSWILRKAWCWRTHGKLNLLQKSSIFRWTRNQDQRNRLIKIDRRTFFYQKKNDRDGRQERERENERSLDNHCDRIKQQQEKWERKEKIFFHKSSFSLSLVTFHWAGVPLDRLYTPTSRICSVRLVERKITLLRQIESFKFIAIKFRSFSDIGWRRYSDWSFS